MQFFVTNGFSMIACGMILQWVMSGVGRSSFFSSPLHPFFIDKIYTQFFSNLLIFVVKVNLFLSRFFCNFTPILSFFFLLKVFFVGGVFFLHSCHGIFRIISTTHNTHGDFCKHFVLGRDFCRVFTQGNTPIHSDLEGNSDFSHRIVRDGIVGQI